MWNLKWARPNCFNTDYHLPQLASLVKHMDQEKIRSNLLTTDHWIRILYMAAFAVAGWVVILILSVIACFQVIIVLLGGEVNTRLRNAGSMFALYFLQLLNYLLYVSEEKPWPFGAFPEHEAPRAASSQAGQTAGAASAQQDGMETQASPSPQQEATLPAEPAAPETPMQSDTMPQGQSSDTGNQPRQEYPTLTETPDDNAHQPDQTDQRTPPDQQY
jgi:hypothetical protein